MEEKLDYFKVGTKESPVVSNSSLTYINPEQGGSPQAFLDFFLEKQEQEKSYYRMGSLIHQWAEDRDKFKVSEVEKPSEKLGLLADNIIIEINNGAVWTDDLGLTVARLMGYQKNYKDDTLRKHVYEGTCAYIDEIIRAKEDNQIFLSRRESETISSCVEAVEKHPVAKELLFMQDTDFSDKKVYKELEIYWPKVFTGNINMEDYQVHLHFKAKLDNLCIDFEKKIVTYVDPKTTSGGVYNFSKSFESYRYYRQQAFYGWAITEWAKQNQIDLTGFSFRNYNIVIETSALFQVGVFNINVKWMEKGKKEYQTLVKRLVEHTATNQWRYSLEEINNSYILDIPFKEEI